MMGQVLSAFYPKDFRIEDSSKQNNNKHETL